MKRDELFDPGTIPSLSDAMIRYRAAEDISQRELARRCGLSIQTINAVENGIQSPSKLTRAKIEKVVIQC